MPEGMKFITIEKCFKHWNTVLLLHQIIKYFFKPKIIIKKIMITKIQTIFYKY